LGCPNQASYKAIVCGAFPVALCFSGCPWPNPGKSIREAAGREKEMRCSFDSTLAYLLEAAGTRGVAANLGNNFINPRF